MSFDDLVKRITPILRKITHKLNKLNGYDPVINEEDLFQEALIHLWVNFEADKLLDKTDSYILQGCYFHLRNYLRKNQNEADLLSLDNPDNGDTLLNELSERQEILFLSDSASSGSPLQAKLLVETLLQEDVLTKREKEVLSLYREGLTVREIGKRLGISHVRVIQLKNKIKNKLVGEGVTKTKGFLLVL
jgi:RNA polymerase sigma factor (sigma-70 family)